MMKLMGMNVASCEENQGESFYQPNGKICIVVRVMEFVGESRGITPISLHESYILLKVV